MVFGGKEEEREGGGGMVKYEVINHIQEAGFLPENKTAHVSAPERC